jgi:hypothetical protein
MFALLQASRKSVRIFSPSEKMNFFTINFSLFENLLSCVFRTQNFSLEQYPAITVEQKKITFHSSGIYKKIKKYPTF